MSEPGIVDAYAHIGLPRFQSVGAYEGIMARSGIRAAVLSAFDAAPDLAAIHAAFKRAPETFRGIGVPLGHDRTEMEAAAGAQLAAGFSGLRLSDNDVVERPWLLDLLGREVRVALVCGRATRPDCARMLLDALERNDRLRVVLGHFAGGGDPLMLASGPLSDLVAHPRVVIQFSRHGAYPPEMIRDWTAALIGTAGWERVVWGSEAPVLFWRNESISDALDWVMRLNPSEEERAALLGGTAHRLYFDAAVEAAPLSLPFDPWSRARVNYPAVIFSGGLPVDQALAGRMVHGWLSAGARDSVGDYLEEVLDRALPALPEQQRD